MDYGFVKVAAAVPELKVADCGFNAGKIIGMIEQAENAGVQIICFPELSITAYTCGDLFRQQLLLHQALTGLRQVSESTKNSDIVVIAGLPLLVDNRLFNCAAVMQKGHIIGIVPKTYIPGSGEFNEKRWFASGIHAGNKSIRLFGNEVPFGTDLLFESGEKRNESSFASSGNDVESGGNCAESGESFGKSGRSFGKSGRSFGKSGRSFGKSGGSYDKSGGKYNICLGVEICGDLWAPIPPSSYQAIGGATILFNLSASNEIVDKYEYRRDLARMQSGRCIAGYVLASAGVDESTTDAVFGGHALVAENGRIINESDRFLRKGQMVISEIDVQKLINDRIKNMDFMGSGAQCEYRRVGLEISAMKNVLLTRCVNPHPFIPLDEKTRNARCKEIFNIQTAGLAKRMEHIGMKNAVVGVSGGLDSTLALIVTAKAFDMLGIARENITAVNMPGFGTTSTTYENALCLIKSVKAQLREISIKQACLKHFEDIGHDPSIHDVTYENVQARERTQILMDIANKQNGLVIGTGDLSELALGWCTYNGDHMSMYSVNCGIPKTLIKHLICWACDNVAEAEAENVLRRILSTPITPELLPPDEKGKIQQKTEDIIGPYELHDFFLYYTVRYGAPPAKLLFLAEAAFRGQYEPDKIKSWLKVFYRRFFSQQFKRSCMPDGPKVGTVSLSPRGGWSMPSDASYEMWQGELE